MKKGNARRWHELISDGAADAEMICRSIQGGGREAVGEN
jgi:hypothetical protein